jgi:DNA recombination protein RmuC
MESWLAAIIGIVIGGISVSIVLWMFWRKDSNQDDGARSLEWKLAFEKAFSQLTSEIRDVSRIHSEALNKTVQDTLLNQTLSVSQRLDGLQHQQDARWQEIRKNVEQRLRENLEQSIGAFKEMSQSLGQLKSTTDRVLEISSQVSQLNQILASPKLQGNFGETALQQLLSDILPEGAYEWQPRIAEGMQPDAAIRIKDARLCIDAKFPKDRLASLLDAAKNDAEREQARKELMRTIRDMASDIAKKYIRPDLGTTDQAFLFVPSEALFYEILRMPELIEHCRKVKISLVSPNTLAATFYGVALAFRGYEMQQNAQKLIQAMQELGRHFDGFQGDFNNVGKRLNQAQEDFAKAQRDLERFNRTMDRLKDGQVQVQED